MRARILAFVQALRRAGIAVSVAEAIDGVGAVAAAGVERPVLREALALTLVKDEAQRPVFDAVFDEAFPLRGAEATPRRRGRRSGGPGDEAAEGRRRHDGEARAGRVAPRTPRRPDGEPDHARVPARAGATEAARDRAGRLPAARRRALLAMPVREMSSCDVAEARVLVAALAQQLRMWRARRERRRRRGRLDVRRTIRAAIQSGGVPLRPRFRGRRPRRPDLVALCDVSGSVAVASELCLGLVAPAASYFRRAALFAYVDCLCPVSIEHGHVAPEGRLDLHARSDFGRVLDDLWRDRAVLLHRGTVVLVLGDARNNRRPPRVDLLRALRERVQRIVWIVPEARARWNTGDSVLGLYAPACDAVIECLTLGELARAARRLFT